MTAAISKPILDMCCGSRMFWLDKQDDRTVFSDVRSEEHTLCDGRHLVISPDVIADFRQLPFADNSFSQVVFDPPTSSGPEKKAGCARSMAHWTKQHGVMISPLAFVKHSECCGHTARSFSNGTKRRYLLRR